MSNGFVDRAEACYQQSEQQAKHYFTLLNEQMMTKEYIQALTQDFEEWQPEHVHGSSSRSGWLNWSLPSRKSITTTVETLKTQIAKPSLRTPREYIQWLRHAGKLDAYLQRSVSYMYMRDLGKDLTDSRTQLRIEATVEDIKKTLLRPDKDQAGSFANDLSWTALYRWSQKEGVERAVIWVMDKIKRAAVMIPEGLSAEHAQRKLIKIIIGVVQHVLDELDEDTPAEERAHRLDEAIRLGYSYGLTYPFIDDLLDSTVLSVAEKERYSDMIRTALLTEAVPELEQWDGPNAELVRYVHSELSEAFEYIRQQLKPERRIKFFEQAYVFFESQQRDRIKDLSHAHYSNEDLYLPIILKAASSRLIVRSVLSAPEDPDFELRTFYYGLYNQLADDFADAFDDMAAGAVTPYTYYLQHHEVRPDLINPYELYWAVIFYLIHRIYRADSQTREIILDRAINGLKRRKERLGAEKYDEWMKRWTADSAEFHHYVHELVSRADDVDFFDKLLRDQMVESLKRDREEQVLFQERVEQTREEIRSHLQLASSSDEPPISELLMQTVNYSLNGDGKLLRPILASVMGVHEYGLDASAIAPLLRSLEYMHTASLIFDDLPSQDNADTRRGRPTLHRLYGSGTAELTGIYLMQRATEEQADLSVQHFGAQPVLQLIRYSSRKAQDICMGQSLDLHSKGEQLTLEQLNTLCFYKTGIAFEAALVMPAILAHVEEAEIEVLRTFAYHAGIAYQIKDDLLDVEGDGEVLGKPVGQDTDNQRSTFVSVLGLDGARQEMWEHYCLAMEALRGLPRQVPFLKHLAGFIIHRQY